MKMNKKIMSLALAGVMSMAMAVPAFAANTTSTNGTLYEVTNDTVTYESGTDVTAENGHGITVSSEVKTPTIRVILPTDNKVILNPYGLTAKLTLPGNTTESEIKDQIIGAPGYIASMSDVPLVVSVKATGTPTSNVTLGTKSYATDTKTTTKNVFLFLKMAEVGVGVAKANATDAEKALGTRATATYTKGQELLIGATESTLDKMITIKASTDVDDVEKAQVVAYQIFGDAVKAPATPWDSSDTVSVALTFTFLPSL